MKFTHTLVATALSVLLFATTVSAAVDPPHNGALAVPANRIVGLWSTQGSASPCGSGLPPAPIGNTLLFQAGGTLAENPRFPPAGAPNVFGVPGINQRGQGLGTWSFDPLTNQYSLFLRFDWYVDGMYHGYQTVDRQMTLSSDGLQATGPVTSTRYTASGTPIASVCGVAISDRL